MQRINIGIVGFGFRSAGVAGTFQSFDKWFTVRSACDIREERREAAKSAGIANVFADPRKLLDDPSLDAVYIGTPQDSHCALVLDAFAAGKHVYCEKPMALSLAECDRMIEASKKAGKLLMVGLQMRYHMRMHKLAELIEAEAIGRPAMIWFDEFRNPFPATMRWAFDKSRSGGTLVEKSCHHFDLFNWLSFSKPVRVLSSGGALVHKEIFGVKSNVADHAVVTVEFESGCKASYRLCMFAGAPDEHEYGLGYHFTDLGVMGTRGMLRTGGWDLGNAKIEQRFADSQNRIVHELSVHGTKLTPYNQDGNIGIFQELYECLTTGRDPFTPGEVGRASLAVSLAAEKSLETGGWVEVQT